MKNIQGVRSHLILFIIIFYAVVSRIWLIGSVPQIINSNIYNRLLTASLSVGSIYLLFVLCKNLFGSNRVALLTSWVFMIMPWTIEQGRITSQVSNSLFLMLLIIILMQKFKSLISRSILVVIIPIILYLCYPSLWIFRSGFNIPSAGTLLNNIFKLVSPDFIFFKNITFWWGGVRETGILYPAFLPFLLLGIMESTNYISKKIWLFISLIYIITAASPYFPETRTLFLTAPFISIIVALGFVKFHKILFDRNFYPKFISLLIIFFIAYDLAQFNHYYFIHYAQNIISNSVNIHEPF